MTTSRIGRGALVTLAGAAASLAGAAGAANACEKPPPEHSCSLSNDDVQWAVNGSNGQPTGKFHSAHKFHRVTAEPVYGFTVKLDDKAIAEQCTGSVDVSLASYTAEGGTWETSGNQTFVDFATVHLTTASTTAESQSLTVKLPGAPGGPCFGQIDLYSGTTKYDGTNGHQLPNFKNHINTPPGLFAAWNGADAGGCAVTPPPPPVTSTTPPPPPTSSQPSTPPTTPPTTTPPTTPPTTSPTSHPSTPVSSTTSTPPTTPPATGTSTTPATPATTTSSPGTPTLAHTGANVGEVSLVALMFFGAGGGAMFASRKAKTAAARKH